jgi:selenide, water dikinase
LPSRKDPRLIVGDNPADDAAVFRMSENLALVQTVDFFTPIVDDPYTFGRIAAANSLSDIYAMGGEPLMALNIVCFPVQSLGPEMLSEILRGGSDMCAEAGISTVGGHTVEDPEPKYGLAVTGTVRPERVMTARGGQAGDALVLTKPLGTGIISTALKSGHARKDTVDQAVRWMTTLNRDGSSAMTQSGAHAATDVTGFGILGHLSDLCSASGISAQLFASRIPMLPGALELAREGHVAGGLSTNMAYLDSRVHEVEELDEGVRRLLYDPQTSGGLLVALPPERVSSFRERGSERMLTAQIGYLVPGTPGDISVIA